MSQAAIAPQTLSLPAQIAKADLAALLLRASMGVLFWPMPASRFSYSRHRARPVTSRASACPPCSPMP